MNIPWHIPHNISHKRTTSLMLIWYSVYKITGNKPIIRFLSTIATIVTGKRSSQAVQMIIRERRDRNLG